MHSFPSTLDLLLQLLHRRDVLGGLIHEYQALRTIRDVRKGRLARAMTCGFSERTTGFEPATPTLAR